MLGIQLAYVIVHVLDSAEPMVFMACQLNPYKMSKNNSYSSGSYKYKCMLAIILYQLHYIATQGNQPTMAMQIYSCNLPWLCRFPEWAHNLGKVILEYCIKVDCAWAELGVSIKL